VKYVNLGSTGMRVSRVCLGMMSYGNNSERPWVLDEDAAAPIVQAAADGGITFYDTADTYSGGASEVATGKLLSQLFRRDEVVVATKVFNPVGPGAPRSTLPGNVTARLKSALNDGGDIRLGPLDAVRDFVDVRDVAEAVVLAATRRFLPHPVINVGSGRPVLTRALVSHLTAISGYTGIIKEDDQGSNRSTGVLWQQADITRAVKDLGWTPRRDLVTSLTDMWEAIP